MKNYEKYRDEIRNYNGNSFCRDFVKPYILKSDNCDDIYCDSCRVYQMLWLLEEYKEPETYWSKVEVDTPILVKINEKGKWIRRHFAKYENGLVYAWKDSRTSWTTLADSDMSVWQFAKLAESEEE